MPDYQTRPFGLIVLAAVYLFFLLLTVTSYGSPFPLLGSLYSGTAANVMHFVDSMIAVYLFLGILKRQRLTVWLIIGYNLFDIGNAALSLALVSPVEYARLSGSTVPQDQMLADTVIAAVILILISVYVYRVRHYFYNRSFYLF